MTKPMITVLALGGTIAMTGSTVGGVVPTLTGENLVATAPTLADIAQLDAESFRQLPGAHLQYDDLEALADKVQSLCQQGCDGIVITQGTDTIEETAFALDCLLDVETPFIVTGAMRNPTVAGADGPANLLAAVRVACSLQARGMGCLVVMNDEIHAARFVRKSHTSRPDAFSSPTSGRIGWISEEQAFFSVRVTRKPVVARQTGVKAVSVALVTATLGDDGQHIRTLLTAPLDGLVVAATGGGHVSPAMADALQEAAALIPVLLASRTGAGNTLAQTYGFPGSEIDLQRRGLIRAGWLDGAKAKILLTLLLRHGVTDRETVAQAFKPWGGGSGL